MELQPGEAVDRYTVEERLGRGGMATVYRVRHQELGGMFALKVLDVPSRSVRDRLRREGEFQQQLRHPNVVAVLDVVTLDGSPALVLEYVDGPTLEELLRLHRPTLAQVDDLARGILLGVRAAHRHGLVHRDLKPANILLQRTDDGFVAKITDFGLAKVLGGDGSGLSQTRTGAVLGTPAYMAPEQFQSAAVDARADLWALGLTLYELCTGARPWEARDLFELADRVRSGTFPLPSTLVPDLPARMEAAIVGALKVSPDDRFADVDAMLAAWTGVSELPHDRGPAWDRALLDSMSRSGGSGASTRPRTEGSGGSPRTWAADSAQSLPSREIRSPARPPTLARRAAPLVAVLGLSLALLLGVGVVGSTTLVWSTRSGAPAPTGDAAAAPTPQPASVSEDVRATVPLVEPASMPREEPTVAQPPLALRGPAGSTGAQRPPDPEKGKRQSESVAGSWTLAGDARRVVLRSAEGVELPPGPVPVPGRYELVATFADGFTATLEVTWSAGDSRAFRCDSSLRRCLETP